MAIWTVQLFAYLRERHGSTVTVEAEPNVKSILSALENSGIAVASARLAVDNEFASADQPVQFGASIALIPPVSGG